jgi:hypothetical protein
VAPLPLLSLLAPTDESIVSAPEVRVSGTAALDAVLTVNASPIEVDPFGRFSTLLRLAPGPNLIQVVASDFGGRQESKILVVVYLPR